MTHHITDYDERAHYRSLYCLWISRHEGRTPKGRIVRIRETEKDKRNRFLATFD